MTLRHLKIFLTVYETGSTTAASEKLLIAQPTISVALKELETHYGIRMFERYSRRLYVTEAGRQLYQYAKHLVTLFDEAEDAMKSLGESGTLRVGSSVTIGNYFLPEYIRQFQKRYPHVRVKVKIENIKTIEQLILNNELDLALVEGKVHSPFIAAHPYRQDTLVMICHPDHPHAVHPYIAPLTLASENILLREKGSAVRELFDIQMNRLGLSIDPLWESISTQAIIRAVKENLGVSFLPYYLVKESVEKGEVAILHVDGADFSREFSIIYHKNKFHSPAFDALIDICLNTKDTPLFMLPQP